MRVLVIEDEPDLLDALVVSLREQDYAVDEAADGTAGLQKAQGTEYDAIVLDLGLPGMDGWEVLTTLRETQHTPVLILTAQDTLSDRIRGLDSGADDYLTKPFELEELHARLRALIRRTAGQSNSVIELGDITIDTAKRRAFRQNETIPLTPREFALLELLALNAGRLVSRTMIYEHLYDESDDSLSNLVDVHVANLRKKLGRELITTRRGEGYEIDV